LRRPDDGDFRFEAIETDCVPRRDDELSSRSVFGGFLAFFGGFLGGFLGGLRIGSRENRPGEDNSERQEGDDCGEGGFQARSQGDSFSQAERLVIRRRSNVSGLCSAKWPARSLCRRAYPCSKLLHSGAYVPRPPKSMHGDPRGHARRM
jgi:hypothetical protein